MITRVHIENFKSLVEFDLPRDDQRLGMFACLIGMNGAGKSTVLQALDFLGQLMVGKLDEWLEQREWISADLASRIPRESVWRNAVNGKRILLLPRRLPTIPFELEFVLPSKKIAIWRGRFSRLRLRCTFEEIRLKDSDEYLLSHSEGVLRTTMEGQAAPERDTKDLIFQGSILSIFNFEEEACKYIKETMSGLKSLEMLTPRAMRRRSRKGVDIGYGGEQLSAFIGSLHVKQLKNLTETVREFYPQLESLGTATVRGGWKRLYGVEKFVTSLPVNATSMNDGMLRVVAILAQAYSTHPVLLFDEIENGINPELVEKLVDFLVGMKKQVIVTTHSPMILNYMEDKVAREGVYLLYRDDAGWTRSVRFFDLPETSDKLAALGPGEVFVDTNLTRLTKRLARRAAKADAAQGNVS